VEGVIVTESVTSLAEKMLVPVVVDLAVNVATPEELVVAETAVIVSVPPLEELTETALPETRLEY
jgi:hypothetical protein